MLVELGLDVLKLVAQSLIDEPLELALTPFPPTAIPGAGPSHGRLLTSARGALWAMALTSRSWAEAALPAQSSVFEIPHELPFARHLKLAAVRVLIIGGMMDAASQTVHDRVLATLAGNGNVRTVVSTRLAWSPIPFVHCTTLVLSGPATSQIGPSLQLAPRLRTLRLRPIDRQPFYLQRISTASSTLTSLVLLVQCRDADALISIVSANPALKHLQMSMVPIDAMPDVLGRLPVTLRHLELLDWPAMVHKPDQLEAMVATIPPTIEILYFFGQLRLDYATDLQFQVFNGTLLLMRSFATALLGAVQLPSLRHLRLGIRRALRTGPIQEDQDALITASIWRRVVLDFDARDMTSAHLRPYTNSLDQRTDVPPAVRVAITAERAQRATILNADRDARAARTTELEGRLADTASRLERAEAKLASTEAYLAAAKVFIARPSPLADLAACQQIARSPLHRAMRDGYQAMRERFKAGRTADAMGRADEAIERAKEADTRAEAAEARADAAVARAEAAEAELASLCGVVDGTVSLRIR